MLAHMGKDGTLEPPVAVTERPSRSALLTARYHEVVRARYIADRAGPNPAPAARLEERLHRFESAAASVEMPSMWYFLESARLIRAGDLTEAKCAFDAGMAAPVVDAATARAEVEDPATADIGVPSPAATDRPSGAAGLAASYREAVRARYIADQPGSKSARGARLEECVQRLEAVAALVEPPLRWYFLKSASLIRAGDLTGAKSAFDAGMAAPMVETAITPVTVDLPARVEVAALPARVEVATVPARTGVAALPPAGRVAALPARVEVGVAPRAVPWDRIALVSYLALLTIAELAVTFGDPLLVFPLHGGIVGLAALHVAALEGRSERQAGRHPLTPFLLAFVVVALIRIISYTLPLAAIEPAYRYLFAGVPMTLGALLVARAAGFSWRDVGLAWRTTWLQVVVIIASIGLGFVEFAILRPVAMGPLPWVAAGVIPAAVVGIATGFPEELIFRGVLQTATRPILGRLNWVYASLVFAALHIGYQSVLDLAFVFGVGLLYGWVFERSRSIIGISIGHGQANVILFFIAPNLPAVARLLGG